MQLLPLYTWSCYPYSYTHGVVTLRHMELLPLDTWSCYPQTHGVVTLRHMELLPLFTPTRMHRLWVKGVRSLGRPVSSLDHCRPARWAVNNADVNGCHVQSPWTSPSRVENTPGHRPAVWRTHQDIAHPCGEHTRKVSTSHTGHLSLCQLWCLFLAAFV